MNFRQEDRICRKGGLRRSRCGGWGKFWILNFGFWIQNSAFKISQPVRPFPVRRYICRQLLGLSVGMAGIVQTGGDAFQAGFELFLGRQVELVFRGEDIGIGRESELN